MQFRGRATEVNGRRTVDVRGSGEDPRPSADRIRRGVLLGAVAGIAAAILGRQEARAATGGAFILGQVNDADATTQLVPTAGRTLNPALHVSVSGTAVAIRGDSTSAGGVVGSSVDGVGVVGGSTSAAGVFGSSATGAGVEGQSPSGAGLQGDSDTGIGVTARSNSGMALQVLGKAQFDTAGRWDVLAGSDRASVANPKVTARSHISVTFEEDPRRATIRWVERTPGVGFTVHLDRAVRSATGFTYLIVEPT